MAITLFKVIQGHQFSYQARMRFLIILVNNTNIILSCTVSKLLQIIGQIFVVGRGVPLSNALDRGEPLNLSL